MKIREIVAMVMAFSGAALLVGGLVYNIVGTTAEGLGAINSCVYKKKNARPCTEERMNLAIKTQKRNQQALTATWAAMGLMAGGVAVSWPAGSSPAQPKTPKPLYPHPYTRQAGIRKQKIKA